MMNCRDTARLLSERLEHPLGRRREWALRFHLLICTACRRYDSQIRWLHKLLRSEARAESAASLGEAARERIVARLHASEANDGRSA
ncbi:MAG: zf-HC2 domain-containing protein [Gammaproteobacteria bacterium]